MGAITFLRWNFVILRITSVAFGYNNVLQVLYFSCSQPIDALMVWFGSGIGKPSSVFQILIKRSLHIGTVEITDTRNGSFKLREAFLSCKIHFHIYRVRSEYWYRKLHISTCISDCGFFLEIQVPGFYGHYRRLVYLLAIINL